MSFFRINSLINRVQTGFSSKFLRTRGTRPYILLEKTRHKSVDRFPKDSWAIPEGADTFTRVLIGKSSDSSYRREIVSFYNKDNKIIHRYQKGTDIPRMSKKYDYSSGVTAALKNVKIRTIATKIYSEDGGSLGVPHWKHVSDVEQFVYYAASNKNGVYSKKVQINKTLYHDKTEMDKAADKFSVVMTEYPATLGFEPKTAKKVMGVDIEMHKGLPYIVGTVESPNVKFPVDDKFLAFRFLKGEQKQEALARYFLKEKGLEDAGIYVGTSESKVSPNAVACFKADKGEIWFKMVPTRSQPISIAAHEAEHAYQHFLIGRLFGGSTDYEARCMDLFGPLIKFTEIREAKKCNVANANYPRTTDTEDLGKNENYMNNYLEVKAREAGEKAYKEYCDGYNFLIKQFPYLPIGRYL